MGVRFNLKTRNVEVRTCKDTEDVTNLQKAADFVRAFIYGFEVEDALALLRLDDLFIDMGWMDGITGCGGDCNIDGSTFTMKNFKLGDYSERIREGLARTAANYTMRN